MALPSTGPTEGSLAAAAPPPPPHLWGSVQGSRDNPPAVLHPQPGQVVGIDLEWRPSFSTIGGKPRVSVVQLAVWGHVFLLDMLQLLRQGERGPQAALSGFFRTLLADPAILKLGKWCLVGKVPPGRALNTASVVSAGVRLPPLSDCTGLSCGLCSSRIQRRTQAGLCVSLQATGCQETCVTSWQPVAFPEMWTCNSLEFWTST